MGNTSVARGNKFYFILKLVLSRYNNGASLTDLKKLRNAMGRFKNNAQQHQEAGW